MRQPVLSRFRYRRKVDFRSFLALPFEGRVWFPPRHPGESRDLFCFGASRQPPHVPVFFTRHPWQASHFLLLAQEKVTKEKGTPEGACPFGLFPPRPRRAQGGPPKSQSRRAKAHPIKAIRRAIPFPRLRGKVPKAEGGALALLLILAPCGAAEGGRKGPAGGSARDRASSAVRPWMACQRNPAARSEPAAQLRAPHPGCPSLWLLSLGQARESDPRAGMRVETHRDVSRLSRSASKQEQRKGTGSRLSPG